MAVNQNTILYIASHSEEIFKRLRWADGLVCPKCQSHLIYKYRNGTYRCSCCHHHFSDKSGTIFHNSKLSVSQWLIILYLMLDGRGMSSIEISKKLGITQPTAWLACNKLRFMFSQSDIKLSGEVAMDEVYLGGSWANFPTYKKIKLLQLYGLWKEGRDSRGRNIDNFKKKTVRKAIAYYKQPVFGMNDGKRIVLQALPNNFIGTDLSESFKRHISGPVTTVSDQSPLYSDWEARTGCPIETNNHSERVFRTSSGRTSNRIEGTFSHLKRRDKFVYVHYEKKHTQLYLNEMAFIWNNRDKDIMGRLEEAFKYIHIRTTRAELLKYDERDNWAVSKRMTVDDAFDTLNNLGSMSRSIEVNGIEYTKDELRNMMLRGIKYMP